jgi:hypothetical protein
MANDLERAGALQDGRDAQVARTALDDREPTKQSSLVLTFGASPNRWHPAESVVPSNDEDFQLERAFGQG